MYIILIIKISLMNVKSLKYTLVFTYILIFEISSFFICVLSFFFQLRKNLS